MKRNTVLANQDIRNAAVKRGIFLWQIAKKLDIASTTLTMWMREELPADDPRRLAILKVLEDAEGGTNGKTEEMVGTTV